MVHKKDDALYYQGIFMSIYSDSVQDLKGAAKNWNISFHFAWEDLRDRYRRSVIGILWISLSFLLFVGIKAFIFSAMNSLSLENFTLYLTLGFALWSLIRALILDGASTYVQSRSWILSSAIPYPTYILQSVIRSFLNFCMILIATLIIMIAMRVPINIEIWSIVPAFFIYFVTGLWVAMLLAPLCARFRDFLYALQTVILMLFFLTPILWVPQDGTLQAKVAAVNPFTHYLAIVRDPIMYGTIPTLSWLITGAISISGLVIGTLVYANTRDRIAFWV